MFQCLPRKGELSGRNHPELATTFGVFPAHEMEWPNKNDIPVTKKNESFKSYSSIVTTSLPVSPQANVNVFTFLVKIAALKDKKPLLTSDEEALPATQSHGLIRQTQLRSDTII